MTNKNLKQRDLQHIWHPCSQMKDYENKIPLISIKKAKGIYLYDYDGNKYIDAISSWWVNILGHSNYRINKIAKRQLDILPHTIFAGFTHLPAIELSEKIISITPKPLNKVFFTDNGSSGVDIALKMSFHYHKLNGKIKPFFVSLKNSYHGESIGAMSVSDVELYKDTYKEILAQNIQIDVPYSDDEVEINRCIKKADDMLKSRDDISSIIIEPLVQCAGSMMMYDSRFIVGLRKLCDKYDIHLIADEIATGFGRTGTMFAMEKSGCSPDIMLVSKALTAGYMPLCLVLTTDKIYDMFYDDYNTYKAFLHSHSYSGNALGCAIASATIDILINDNIIEKNQKKIAYIKKKSKIFKALKSVKDIRQTGFILAMELDFDIKERVNIDIYNYCLKNGVFLRPLANVLYFMPAYIITYKEIDIVFDIIYKAIKKFL
jgi:adenosylmethionine-8-amino-7-oxononanoate aminotransferase